jgi:hypothetical protein
MHSVTPCVLQKIEVRAPIGTLAGEAQISTRTGIVDTVVVAEDAGVGCVILNDVLVGRTTPEAGAAVPEVPVEPT